MTFHVLHGFFSVSWFSCHHIVLLLLPLLKRSTSLLFYFQAPVHVPALSFKAFLVVHLSLLCPGRRSSAYWPFSPSLHGPFDGIQSTLDTILMRTKKPLLQRITGVNGPIIPIIHLQAIGDFPFMS